MQDIVQCKIRNINGYIYIQYRNVGCYIQSDIVHVRGMINLINWKDERHKSKLRYDRILIYMIMIIETYRELLFLNLFYRILITMNRENTRYINLTVRRSSRWKISSCRLSFASCKFHLQSSFNNTLKWKSNVILSVSLPSRRIQATRGAHRSTN